MLALAEAIIPGTSTIPGADDTTVREVAGSWSPGCRRGWAPRGLPPTVRSTPPPACAPAARSTRSPRPASRRCSMQWERDPLLKIPLSVIVERLQGRPLRRAARAAGDGGAAQAAAPGHRAALGPAGPRRRVVDRRRRRVRRGGRWGPARAGRWWATSSPRAATRWSSSRRGSSTTATASTAARCAAYERFYRPVFAVGNATFPVFVGRMVGGSTAVNGGTAFRTPSWVLDRWCEEMGTDAFEPSRMAPYFEQVETHLGVGAVLAPARGAHRRRHAAGLRRARLEARRAAQERAGVRGVRLLPPRLPERRPAGAPTSPTSRRRWSGARCSSPA